MLCLKTINNLRINYYCKSYERCIQMCMWYSNLLCFRSSSLLLRMFSFLDLLRWSNDLALVSVEEFWVCYDQ